LSEWTVKLKPMVVFAGIGGMMNPNGSSEFIIVADKFQVCNITETNLTSGTLITGRYYQIKTYVSDDDFTNVGAASNATGVIFKATGTTPTHWGHSSILNEILVPFIVGNINGESAVGINGNLLVDGSILARSIGTNEIIANSANIKDAIITNAKIASLDVSKLTAGTVTSKKSL